MRRQRPLRITTREDGFPMPQPSTVVVLEKRVMPSIPLPESSPYARARAHQRWRNSYESALQACGDSSQERKADLAICACVQRLSETTPKDTSEREEIGTALDDLKLLKFLYSRHS
jgi:hypothetical protein